MNRPDDDVTIRSFDTPSQRAFSTMKVRLVEDDLRAVARDMEALLQRVKRLI